MGAVVDSSDAAARHGSGADVARAVPAAAVELPLADLAAVVDGVDTDVAQAVPVDGGRRGRPLSEGRAHLEP